MNPAKPPVAKPRVVGGPGTVAPKPQPKPVQVDSGHRVILPPTVGNFNRHVERTLGRHMTIIGKPGIGKTSFVAEMPDPVFICDPLETGILDLIKTKRIGKVSAEQVLVPQNAADLTLILTELLHSPGNVKSVILESYLGVEKMIMTDLCEKKWKNDWGKGGFLSFQEGPRAAASRDLPQVLLLLQKLREKGVNTAITGHTMVKNAANAEGADYQAELPYCVSKDMWQAVEGWSENIIYMVYQVNTEKMGGAMKATGGVPTMIMHRSGGYGGKNKWGINTYLSMDGLSPEESFLMLCRETRMDPKTLLSL